MLLLMMAVLEDIFPLDLPILYMETHWETHWGLQPTQCEHYLPVRELFCGAHDGDWRRTMAGFVQLVKPRAQPSWPAHPSS